MANLKSSKKDLRRIAKRRMRNLSTKSALKTFVKKARAAAGSEIEAPTLTVAVKALDKAAQKGIIHPNQAARRKSRLMKAVSKAKAPA